MKFPEFVIAMGITVVVTELSYRYIETPIRRGSGRCGGAACVTATTSPAGGPSPRSGWW